MVHIFINTLLLINQTSFFTKAIEYRAMVSNQVLRRIKFANCALIQHKNSVKIVVIRSALTKCLCLCLPVGIHDSVDSMRNGEDGAIDKLFSNGLLNDRISLDINLYSQR